MMIFMKKLLMKLPANLKSLITILWIQGGRKNDHRFAEIVDCYQRDLKKNTRSVFCLGIES